MDSSPISNTTINSIDDAGRRSLRSKQLIGGAKDWRAKGWGGDGLGKLGLTGPGVVGLRVGWTSTGRIRGEC